MTFPRRSSSTPAPRPSQAQRAARTPTGPGRPVKVSRELAELLEDAARRLYGDRRRKAS